MQGNLVYGRFDAFIEDPEHIYDGDTVDRVHFRLPGLEVAKGAPLGQIYPDLYTREDGVWMRINVRLAGIDAPERHPHHSYPDGTPRPPEDIAYEHELAMKARQVVMDMVKANGLHFVIRNPQIGKYAGRIVAEVWCPLPGTNIMTNVCTHLLKQNLAYKYDGGTKKVWSRNKSA